MALTGCLVAVHTCESSVCGRIHHLIDVFSTGRRGVETIHWQNQAAGGDLENRAQLVLSSLDVPIVFLGRSSPFPTPRLGPPKMVDGVHWLVANNVRKSFGVESVRSGLNDCDVGVSSVERKKGLC